MNDQFPHDVVEAVARAMCDGAPWNNWSTTEGLWCARATDAIRALTALGYRRVPAGHVVVPREATEEQARAAYERDMGPDECLYRSIYRAMVAAADPD